jgi:hypothetical protein
MLEESEDPVLPAADRAARLVWGRRSRGLWCAGGMSATAAAPEPTSQIGAVHLSATGILMRSMSRSFGQAAGFRRSLDAKGSR